MLQLIPDFGVAILILFVGVVFWGAIKETIEKHGGDTGLENKMSQGLKTILEGAGNSVNVISIIGFCLLYVGVLVGLPAYFIVKYW